MSQHSDTFGAPNPEDRSFWAQFFEGAGNLAGMGRASLAAGVAGSVASTPVGGTVAAIGTGAGIGAAMNTSQLYREAREMGADEATAERAARWGALIGTSEIRPIARAFKYLPQGVRQKVGNGVMKRFADIAQSAGEEAAQEYLATVANNMVAQQLYDPDRGWTEGATEAALVGAALGATAGGIGAGYDAYRNREPKPLPDPGADDGTVPPGPDQAAGTVPPVAASPSEQPQEAPTPTSDVVTPQQPDPAQSAALPSPMTDALEGAPQAALGGFNKEQPVQIQLVDPETGELSDPIEAIFVGEDVAGGYASFRGPDGSLAEIDLADIASGNVIVSPVAASVSMAQATQPPAGEVIPLAQPQAAPMPPVPAGVDPDAFMERVAIREADGMPPDEAYQMTLQDALGAMREDVGAIAADVEDRQRREREEQSRIDEGVFTDERGQPVVFPSEALAHNRLGAGYAIEPFGEGFIGVRQQEGSEGVSNDGVGGDGIAVEGGGVDASGGDADRAGVGDGRDGAALGPVEQGAAQGVADAVGDADTDAALTPSPIDGGAAAEGPFGPVITGYEGDWKGAALELERRKTGEAPGALSHPDVGPIALVWGKEGDKPGTGYGLAKIRKRHPEVLDDLQGRISRASVQTRSPNRVRLSNPKDQFVVSLDWQGDAKTWLLTAFEKQRPGTRSMEGGVELPEGPSPSEPLQAKRNPNNRREQDRATPAEVDYPNRKLNMRKARADAPVNGIGDNSDMSLGNVALANAREGDVLPGIGSVAKVTDKQIQITKPDGKMMRRTAGNEKFYSLARDMGALIASSANLRDEQLGSLMDMIERDPALVYRDGVPMLFDDPAEQANRGQRAQRGILKLLAPTRQEVEQAAAQADPNPTDAQKEAENYKTGKVQWNGLTLSIENAKGSERSKKAPDGKTRWSVTMPAHYGRILRTEGADGDHVDFYMGDVPDSDYVLIINQVDPETQKMDEHKVIIGTTARGAALGIYRDGFSDGSGNSRIGSFTETNVENLKAWLASGETKTPTQPIDMPFAKRKAETKNPTQGASSLPGGVPDGETRAEDQGAAKIMLRRARVLAGEINDTEAFRKFMVDGRKPVSEQLVQEAESYIRDNQNRPAKSLTWADFDERSDNDPKMPEGYELTVIRRMTKEEAEAEGYQWPTYKAVVKRDKPAGTYKVESGISENSRANAIGVALERAKKGAEAEIKKAGDRRAADGQGPQSNPAEMSADDILNAAFDDVFGAVPETPNDPSPEAFEGNETEARKQGRKDFARDMPRRLPSYIDSTDAAAANGWYAGWDEANVAAPTPGAMEEKPMVDLPDQDPATAWDSASDGERASVFTATGWGLKDGGGLKEVAKRNVERDWKDLTPTAQGKVRQAIENGMMIGDYGEAERRSRDNPQTPPRTAGEAAQSATSNAAEGIGNIVDGLNALFGGTNKLSSGLTFDAETYARAKPMFIAAVRAFGRAGQDIMDMARAMVRGLSANGLTQEAQENMRPYLTQFINDMRDGTVDPFAEDVQAPAEGGNVQPEQPEATDEQYADQEGDTGEPAPEGDRTGAGEPDGAPDSGPADYGRGEGYEDGAGGDAGDDAGGSLGDGPGSVSDRTGDTRAGTAPPNFVIADDFPLGEGTDGQKLAANIEALRLVRTLETENRYATPEEQAVLARWVGWGGLKTVFDGKHEGTTTQWGRAQAEIKELLTTDEYIAAMRSTNDAHYTSRTVVKSMWRAMRNFGFDGGRALEPTIGSGNFLGLQPADLSANTEWFAAELDATTGKIAKHLYPQARVFDGMGFQDAPFKRAAFDVAIGNPPFGATQIGNKTLHPDLGKMKVHNFIIAKTGQLLREGGVMSMVVTHRFLDTPNPEARKALAPDFRFLGAIRLPNTAFAENANTEVTTDIVFFQKRREGETDNDATWLETGFEGPNGTRLNRYFAENPDMILGRAAMDGTMYAGGRKEGGKGEFTVHPDGRDLEASLNEAVDKIEATIPPREQALEDATTARENSSTLPYGAMTLTKDGRIFRGEEDEAGNRVVQEVTADSFWKDNAEAQGRVAEALGAVVAAKGKDTPLSERLNIEQEAKNAAIDAGLIDLGGDPVAQKTKYETGLADSLSNLIFSDRRLGAQGVRCPQPPAKCGCRAPRGYCARWGVQGFHLCQVQRRQCDGLPGLPDPAQQQEPERREKPA